MNDQSNGQKLFLTRLRRHRITVLISRVLILTVFLFLWELCARFEIIDSFIFSSPSKITLCFLEMLKNRSLFLHIGITLYETFISFILVILLSILAAILLWYNMLRERTALSRVSRFEVCTDSFPFRTMC